MSSDSEKPNIIGGNWTKYCTVAKSVGRGRPIWTLVVVRARASLALCGRFNQFRSPYSWITMRRALRKRRVFDFVPSYLKGSVERSLLPWAIFLIFTRNRPWESEDHLCTLFFIEMSKERLEKSERTPPVSWRPWALAYSRDRQYNLSCLSAMLKSGRLRSLFLVLGCHLPRKSLSWPAMPVSNKKQEFGQRKRIELFGDFWVRAYRFDFAPRRWPRARSM